MRTHARRLSLCGGRDPVLTLAVRPGGFAAGPSFLSLAEMFNSFSMTNMGRCIHSGCHFPISFQDCGRADSNHFAVDLRFCIPDDKRVGNLAGRALRAGPS